MCPYLVKKDLTAKALSRRKGRKGFFPLCVLCG